MCLEKSGHNDNATESAPSWPRKDLSNVLATTDVDTDNDNSLEDDENEKREKRRRGGKGGGGGKENKKKERRRNRSSDEEITTISTTTTGTSTTNTTLHTTMKSEETGERQSESEAVELDDKDFDELRPQAFPVLNRTASGDVLRPTPNREKRNFDNPSHLQKFDSS
ncbi:hypothetical protein RFI_27032, partial [Reticulomyxa filosa]